MAWSFGACYYGSIGGSGYFNSSTTFMNLTGRQLYINRRSYDSSFKDETNYVNCTVYWYKMSQNQNTPNTRRDRSYSLDGVTFRNCHTSMVGDDDILYLFVVENSTGLVYACFYEWCWQYAGRLDSSQVGSGYSLTSLPNQSWVNALNAAGVPGTKMTAAAAAAAAAAWPSLQSLSVPTTTTLSSANSTKSTAQGYWNTISQAGSGWSYYSQAQSKYNEIVTAVSNIEARDNAYNSLTGLTTPTNTTVQATAKAAKDNADTYWSTIQAKTNSGWSNWSAAQTKHTAIVNGYNNTVTRDTRLNKKADKTELNASNSKVRVDYTTPHTKGTADYTSIKSTLASVNKRLNS